LTLIASRHSISKHARAYFRFVVACAFASPAVSRKSPQEVDRSKAWWCVWGLFRSVWSSFLLLAIVTDLFAIFLREIVKKCVDSKSGHTSVRAWLLRPHIIRIGNGDRSKRWGWPVGVTSSPNIHGPGPLYRGVVPPA
jgi:hypothetical protein